jgi:NADP-dependent aldehyde dehydrogenase
MGARGFNAVNPFDGTVLEPRFYEAVNEEVDQAFLLAEQALGVYRRKSPLEKAAFLDRIGDEIMALGDALIQRCMQETALPGQRLKNERGRTVNQLKSFAGVLREGSWVEARIDTAEPDRQPLPKPDIRQMLIPLGAVGVFGASNFPLAFSTAGGDTASALAAGCPVVVKAHPCHPGTSEMVARAIRGAVQATDMPDGIFSMVHGQSQEVGMAVVKHPLARAVGFTGSFAGGKALYDAAVRRPEPIPVYAEMGSANPVFLLPGALKERSKTIAQGLAASITLGVGQFCTKPGLIFLIRSKAAEEFIGQTVGEMDGIAPGTMLSKKIKETYDSGVRALINMNGIELKTGGKAAAGNCQGMPRLLQTTALEFIANPRLDEEVFGPTALMVIADDNGQLMEAASCLKGHLTASIHCADRELEDYAGLTALLENKVGRLIIDGFPTGVEVCPSMHHGGPFPATADVRVTSVGTAAIKRFARPVCYQNFPLSLLPEELKNENPLKILRLVNGKWTREKI